MNNLPLRSTCQIWQAGQLLVGKAFYQGEGALVQGRQWHRLSGSRGGMLCLSSSGMRSRSSQQVSEEPGLGKEGTTVCSTAVKSHLSKATLTVSYGEFLIMAGLVLE